MIKLEVGMYVRNEKGIAKYVGLGLNVLKDDGTRTYNHWKSKHLFDNYIFNEEWGDSLTTLSNIENLIIGEPTFNILDLIEVGDIIQTKDGKKYAINHDIKIEQGSTPEEQKITIDWQKTIYLSEIDTILVKESFEENSYSLGS